MLVTGGASFIGSHLVDRLVELGAIITVVDDLSSGKLENLNKSINNIKFVKKDLEFLSNFGEVTAAVSILNVDEVTIDILVQEPGNLTKREFQFIWDATKSELISSIII